MQLGTRPKAQVDAGFESETRGFADAEVSVARNSRRGNHKRRNSRRGFRVARMADAGIIDAGFESQDATNARLEACV